MSRYINNWEIGNSKKKLQSKAVSNMSIIKDDSGSEKSVCSRGRLSGVLRLDITARGS